MPVESNMTLDEWALLSESTRRRLGVRWYESGMIKIEARLAGTAAQELGRQLSAVKGVAQVYSAGSGFLLSATSNACEAVIYVKLYKPSKTTVTRVPGNYRGFRVVIEDLTQRCALYHRTWIRLFKEVSGWTRAKTLRWAKRWEEGLTGRDSASLVYIYGPIKLAKYYLIPKSIARMAGPNSSNLEDQVCYTIISASKKPTLEPDFEKDSSFNWPAVRKVIKELFAVACLPSKMELDYSRKLTIQPLAPEKKLFKTRHAKRKKDQEK